MARPQAVASQIIGMMLLAGSFCWASVLPGSLSLAVSKQQLPQSASRHCLKTLRSVVAWIDEETAAIILSMRTGSCSPGGRSFNSSTNHASQCLLSGLTSFTFAQEEVSVLSLTLYQELKY